MAYWESLVKSYHATLFPFQSAIYLFKLGSPSLESNHFIQTTNDVIRKDTCIKRRYAFPGRKGKPQQFSLQQLRNETIFAIRKPKLGKF